MFWLGNFLSPPTPLQHGFFILLKVCWKELICFRSLCIKTWLDQCFGEWGIPPFSLPPFPYVTAIANSNIFFHRINDVVENIPKIHVATTYVWRLSKSLEHKKLAVSSFMRNRVMSIMDILVNKLFDTLLQHA